MFTLTISVQHSVEVLVPEIRPGKEKIYIQTVRGEVKLSLYVDDMILYIGNLKESTQKLPVDKRIQQSMKIKDYNSEVNCTSLH